MQTLLVAGCGYLGREIASRAVASGAWKVTGITRSAESAAHLGSELFPVKACDLSDEAQVAELAGSVRPDVILLCLSSGRGGVEGYRQAYLTPGRLMHPAFPQARQIFAGSTSVYAQTDGGLVTEESPAEPPRETGRILRQAEDEVLARGGSVARLAGLYGPGRSVLLAKFLAGESVLEEAGSRWLNMIHRDDAATALLHLAARPGLAGIFNATDGTPIRQRDLFEFLARELGRAMPPAGPVDHSRKRGWTSKRVSNARLRSAGWSPRFASFQDAFREQGLTLSAARA